MEETTQTSTESTTTTTTTNTTTTPATTTKEGLVFLIDITGSMSAWIAALNSLLPPTLRSMSLSHTFDHIGILWYSDYDQPVDKVTGFSGFCDTLDTKGVAQLMSFAGGLRPTGGGGHPEATKSALLHLAREKYEGRVHVLHLTDAPPHAEGSLDTEGKKEKQHLGDKFDWLVVERILLEAHPGIRFTCLSTCQHAFYAHLAHITGSTYHTPGSVDERNLRTGFGKIINGWLGLEGSFESQWCFDASSSTTCKVEKELCSVRVGSEQVPPPPDRKLAQSLLGTMGKMKNDPVFLQHVIEEFQAIIESAPLSLTVSPVLGKMWREFCKRRSDPRRKELVSLLSSKKHSLPEADKTFLEQWLATSYDSSSEITADIKVWMATNETRGLLRYVPEADSLTPQMVIQSLAACDRKSTAALREILCRLYIDEDYRHPAVKLDDEDALPLPEATIPLNLKDFAGHVMHVVVPGTLLSLRYSAVLALHAMQCECVLAPSSAKFLQRVKGKWINWEALESDGTAQVPENWSIAFLNLILHPNCADVALTEEEKKKAEFFRSLTYLGRFHQSVEVTVTVPDLTTYRGKFPDHPRHCASCDKNRPLTLFTAKGTCGLCEYEDTKNLPTMEQMNYIQDCCAKCMSLYQRNSETMMSGATPYCHGCRMLGKPSPSLKCKSCNLSFCHFLEGEGLPGDVCRACAEGISRHTSLTEIVSLAHQVFEREHFVSLCASLGFKIKDEYVPRSPLIKAIAWVEVMEPIEAPPPVIMRGNAVIKNIPENWEYVRTVLSGAQVRLPECSVCMEESAALVACCGRKGCKQRVCLECSKSWWSKNTPGTLIYQRATLCQFCCRVPSARTLSRVDGRLIALATSISKQPLNPDAHYAWCTRCFLPAHVGQRACGVPPPEKLVGFTCDACNTRAAAAGGGGGGGGGGEPAGGFEAKPCPGCEVMVSKISGCNHIHCTACDSHWCWRCGQKFGCADDVYEHMWSTHGGIFDEDRGYGDDER